MHQDSIIKDCCGGNPCVSKRDLVVFSLEMIKESSSEVTEALMSQDIEEAQQKIINFVRRLEDAGEIVIPLGLK